MVKQSAVNFGILAYKQKHTLMKNLLALFGIAILLTACGSDKKSEDKSEENGIKLGQQKTSASKADLKSSIERGEQLYTSLCVACHMPNGQGVTGAFPPLDGSNWLTEKRAESIHSVKYGQQGEITVNDQTYNGVMAPLGLSDKEVADVLNYVMNSWSNSQDKMVTEQEVAAVTK